MGKTSKDKRDIYYRKAKEQGYRARSAFKLLQLDDTFHLLAGASSFLQPARIPRQPPATNYLFNISAGSTRVVDLCAAPGGWSQVIAERLGSEAANSDEDKTIVAVDLMEMAPLPGVLQLQGDITHQQTADAIIARFHGRRAHVVVSDGAPDVLGLHDLDEYLQAQLVLTGLNISLHVLEDGGAFVAKIFRGKEVSLLFAQLRRFFAVVTCAKPKASRNSSFESFVVCQGFQLPAGYEPSMERNLLDMLYLDDLEEEEDNEEDPWSYNSNVSADRGVCVDVLFQGSGDVFGLDADQSYPLEEDGQASSNSAVYVHQEPLQKPINPPYANALKKKSEQH